MFLLLMFLASLLLLNALAFWRGADSRDGRDWKPLAPASFAPRR